MMLAADIPLEKASKLKSLLVKYCEQGGTLTQDKTSRTDYVPKLYTEHVEQLKKLLKDEPVAIVADETTDVRDHSILNVLAIVRGKSYLIDVITLAACNHQTLSRGIVSAVQAMEIDNAKVTALITLQFPLGMGNGRNENVRSAITGNFTLANYLEKKHLPGTVRLYLLCVPKQVEQLLSDDSDSGKKE